MAHDVKQQARKVKQAAISGAQRSTRPARGTPNQRIAARVKALRSE
jgi:hypothetical protein